MMSSSAIGSPEIFLPVNWTDGMKINKDHFRAEQQAYNWQQALHSRAALNDSNYGLFPTGDTHVGRPVVITTDNQQQVSIRLPACQAITPGGYLVYLREGSIAGERRMTTPMPALSLPYAGLAANDAEYLVMLAVDPYIRIPAGTPDMQESQLRSPFTAPTYRLTLVDIRDAARGTPADFFLPLGRIRVSEGKVLSDEDYVPPCTCMAAHPVLTEWHAELEQFFGKMESFVLRIQQKIVQKGQQNDLAAVVVDLCNTIASMLAGEYQRVLLEYASQPPVRAIAGLAGLARLLKNRLDVYAGALKDELLNYFADWCGIQQGEWESVLTAASTVRYDHAQIREALRPMDACIDFMLRLFASLAALEYIGKKREAGIFVKEHLVVPAEEAPTARRRSFLAE
jgi:Bacterial Type VI secretion, VC_A0110, EvfL, ImpJ, VasE